MNRYVLTVTKEGKQEWIPESQLSGGGGSMVYPAAGMPVSTGSAWAASKATNTIPMFASAITGTPSNTTFLRGDGAWVGVGGSMTWPAGAGIAVYSGSSSWSTSISGTSSQFVKGNGTLDSTSYAPLASPTFTGTVTLPINQYICGTGNYKMFYRTSTTHFLFTGATDLQINNNADNATLMTVLNGGNVGVNTSSPAGLFTVKARGSSSTDNLIIESSSTTNPVARLGTFLVDTNTGGLQLLQTNTVKVQINAGGDSYFNGGNVGIGTTAPLKKFQVDGDMFTNGGGGLYFGYHVYPSALASITDIWTAGNDHGLAFSTAYGTASEKMRILSTGNVLIGQTSGAEKLCVTGNQVITSGYLNSEELRGNTTFVSGFAGAGYKLLKSGSDYNLEVDNLIVRKSSMFYQIDINKINSTNGGILISAANGKTISVAGTTFYFDEDGTNKQIQFQTGDYIRAQTWTGRGTGSYIGQVTSVTHSATYGSANIIATTVSGTPYAGMELVQYGSSTAGRQSLIYMTASDTNNPYIEGHDGVSTGTLSNTTRKFRLGNLSGITDPIMGSLSGLFGLYSQAAYLTGRLVLPSAGMTSEGGSGTDIRIYAGDTYANRATAPFRVDQNGSLTAIGIAQLGTANVGGMNTAIQGPHIWENNNTGQSSTYINVQGYQAGTTQYRDTYIGDGKGNYMYQFYHSASPAFHGFSVGGSGMGYANTHRTVFYSSIRVFGPITILSESITADNFILNSDEHLKRNKKPIETFKKMDAPFISFQMKDDPTQMRYGIGAQSLQKTHPELIRKTENGTLSVAYIDLFVLKIAYLEQRIKELENRI
jgi:hypothetical protein